MSFFLTSVSKFDEALFLVSGTASGVWGLGLLSSRVGFETDLPAATLSVLVPAFFAAFVGWPSFSEVDSPVAAASLERCWFVQRFQGITRCLP